MARDFPGGTGTYLRVSAPHPLLDFGGTALTAMAWVRPDNPVTGDMIFAKEDGSGNYWDFFLESSILQARVREASGSDIVTGTSTISTTHWNHVVMRKNGTGVNALEIYLNGVVEGQVTSNHAFDTSTGVDFHIGARGQDDGNWDGWIAEVAVWDLALTPAEILSIYRGASPLGVQLANLRGYWPICGIDSPERDLAQGQPATLSGAPPQVAHVPVISPCVALGVPQHSGWPGRS